MEDFDEALQRVKPSITPQMENRYRLFQQEKTA
jgi:hypothetical protein